MAVPGVPSSTAQHSNPQANARLIGFEKGILDEGNALRINTAVTSHLYHKCTIDSASDQFKEISCDTIQIYTLNDEPDNPSFDSVFFYQLQSYLQENCFNCQCSLGAQLQHRPGITVLQLELDPVDRPAY